MQLSKELIEMFQALHRERFGDEISYESATVQLSELASLVRITSPRKETTQNAQTLHR